jgi:pyruvate/2-oxoglutarate dehydrogenase complex dihydrolipoamide dehydrogenase (E3) component
VTAVEGLSGKVVKLHFDGELDHSLEGTHLLVATGRTPNTAGIGLELAGVELTDLGHIKVDEHLRTTAPGVWAIGDCAGSPHFTHISFDDFRVIRDDFAEALESQPVARSRSACSLNLRLRLPAATSAQDDSPSER